jgi:archaellum component FlaF (FlaF/FlaG flagellin family)
VIAGLCFVAILLLSFYVYADSVNRLSTISWRSIEAASSIGSGKLNSRLSITKAVVASDRTKLYVNVTNDGTVKIDHSEFAQMDVFLTYAGETYYCYYNSSDSPVHDSSKYTWSLNSSFPNPYPSVVNPLDWDPSKILSLVVALPASPFQHYFEDHTYVYVKVVLPQGSSNAYSFLTGT